MHVTIIATLSTLTAARMVNKIPGPTECNACVEKIAMMAAAIERAQLLTPMAVADLPGCESTRYTLVGVKADIWPKASKNEQGDYIHANTM